MSLDSPHTHAVEIPPLRLHIRDYSSMDSDSLSSSSSPSSTHSLSESVGGPHSDADVQNRSRSLSSSSSSSESESESDSETPLSSFRRPASHRRRHRRDRSSSSGGSFFSIFSFMKSSDRGIGCDDEDDEEDGTVTAHPLYRGEQDAITAHGASSSSSVQRSFQSPMKNITNIYRDVVLERKRLVNEYRHYKESKVWYLVM